MASDAPELLDRTDPGVADAADLFAGRAGRQPGRPLAAPQRRLPGPVDPARAGFPARLPGTRRLDSTLAAAANRPGQRHGRGHRHAGPADVCVRHGGPRRPDQRRRAELHAVQHRPRGRPGPGRPGPADHRRGHVLFAQRRQLWRRPGRAGRDGPSPDARHPFRGGPGTRCGTASATWPLCPACNDC